jgi:hypothetical protein
MYEYRRWLFPCSPPSSLVFVDCGTVSTELCAHP